MRQTSRPPSWGQAGTSCDMGARKGPSELCAGLILSRHETLRHLFQMSGLQESLNT